jgi:hypothetical protein
MLTTLALHAALTVAAPDLPVFSDATFDEAVAKFWPATAMVLVVADEQFTQQDWERSDWADPELTEFFRSERVPVVYADLHENRAACWLLDFDSVPAVIAFVRGEERGRRYGLSLGEAKELVEWYELVRSGSSPAAKLRERIAASPDKTEWRWELIQELHQSGEKLEMHTEVAWFLSHPDRLTTMDGERRIDDAEIRPTLLWFIASMREKLGFAYDDPRLGVSRKLADDPKAVWRELERLVSYQRPAIGIRVCGFTSPAWPSTFATPCKPALMRGPRPNWNASCSRG